MKKIIFLSILVGFMLMVRPAFAAPYACSTSGVQKVRQQSRALAYANYLKEIKNKKASIRSQAKKQYQAKLANIEKKYNVELVKVRQECWVKQAKNCGVAKPLDYSSGNTFNDQPDTRKAWQCFTSQLNACRPAKINYAGETFYVTAKNKTNCEARAVSNDGSKKTCTISNDLWSYLKAVNTVPPMSSYLPGFNAMMLFNWGTGDLPENMRVGFKCS